MLLKASAFWRNMQLNLYKYDAARVELPSWEGAPGHHLGYLHPILQ